MDYDKYSDDERNDFFGNDYFDDEPTLAEEAEEVPSDKDVLSKLLEKEDAPARKRIVRNPQPKLDEAAIVGPKGIQALISSFQGYKPDVNKDPYQNLDYLLKKYENWSHVLFPRMKFDDVINRCENLGTKARVKVYLNKVRLGMPLTDEDFAPRTSSRADEIITTENNEDGVITSRDDSDEENYYDPFESKKRDVADKVKSPPSKRKATLEDDLDAAEHAQLELEAAAEEEARRQFEMEADEMMADFDY